MDTYGNVWIRLNTNDGGAADLEIDAPWVEAENPASDVAAVPFPEFLEVAGAEPLIFPPHWCVTQDAVRERRIGIGDDLIVMGLFSRHIGTTRNLPIVRSGNIASMPHEQLMDPLTALGYDAYLAEVRSIGGLSGSPVCVVLNDSTRFHGGDRPESSDGIPFMLLGLIRGHWTTEAEADFLETDFSRLNSGIAIVTPITDVLPLLETDAFVRYGVAKDAEWDALQASREET